MAPTFPNKYVHLPNLLSSALPIAKRPLTSGTKICRLEEEERSQAMISILAQERLLGAALGSVFAGVVVFEQRRRIYESISQTQSQFASKTQVKKPVFEKRSHLDIAHLWNKAVDQAFGAVIESVSSRGW